MVYSVYIYAILLLLGIKLSFLLPFLSLKSISVIILFYLTCISVSMFLPYVPYPLSEGAHFYLTAVILRLK